MTETAKQFVISKYPDAECYRSEIHSRNKHKKWYITDVHFKIESKQLENCIAKGESEKEAWENARKRIMEIEATTK